MNRPLLQKPAAATLAVTLILSGCAQSLKRPEHALTVQTPSNWTAAEMPDAPPDAEWWTYFDDSLLSGAIERSLERNHDLRAASARIDAARQQAQVANAASLPSLDAGFNRIRQRNNFIGLPIPGGEDSVLTTINTNLGLSLNLSWEADVWGKVRNGRLAALVEVQAAEADLAGARLSLTGQAAKVWFSALEAKRQVGLAKAALESYRTSAERVRARFSSGIRSSLDLRLALTEVSRAESQLEQRRQQMDAAVRQLEILMGDYPKAAYELAEDLPGVPESIPAGLPAELVHRRPDLVAAERRLLAADAQIAQSRADLKPRFNLTASSGTATNQLQDILSGDVLVWSLLSGVTAPIFNNGRLKAQVRTSEARAYEAAANFESALLRSYGEVETALAADRFLSEQETALEEATRQAVAAQRLAEDRYRSGLSDIITVLQSQRTAIDSESTLLTVRRARLDNRVDLHLALGGGFSMTSTSPSALPKSVGPKPSISAASSNSESSGDAL